MNIKRITVNLKYRVYSQSQEQTPAPLGDHQQLLHLLLSLSECHQIESGG